MWYIGNDESPSLSHHGILGMKWGIRRFQNKDGTYNTAGKKRYGIGDGESYEGVKGGKTSTSSTQSKSSNSSKSSSNQSKNDKIKPQKVSSKQKSVEKYKSQGMTDEQAERAAKRADTTKKILVAVGATAAVAAISYAAYKHYDEYADKLIKGGTKFQNISKFKDKNLNDAFYLSTNAKDAVKYRGIYGDQLGKGPFGLPNSDSIYKLEGHIAEGGVKQAGYKKAIETIQNLYKKDSDYKTAVDGIMKDTKAVINNGLSPTSKQKALFQKAVDSYDKGKMDKNVYEVLNLYLTSHDNGGHADVARSKLFDSLKTQGYDAIRDVNDQKYSGYNSKNPLIMFGGSSKAIKDSVSELSRAQIQKDYNKGYDFLAKDALAKNAVQSGSAILAAYGLGKAISVKTDNRIVADYMKEHPNSKLSYDQILDNYKKKK